MRENPDPVPRTGEVRVRVEASGVSMPDVLCRAGRARQMASPPFVPGFEVAGTVDMVAQGATGFQEGQPVVALTYYGGYADLVCVPHRQVFPRMEWLDAEDGAALPVDYLTAYVSLVVMGSVRKDSRVLIHAADSGVGVSALHICRILGADSYGTALTARHDFLTAQGLQHPIDHVENDYESMAWELSGKRGFDVILNPYGDVHLEKNYRLLAPTGRLIHLGNSSAGPVGQPRLPARLLRFLAAPVYTPERLMNENKGVLGLQVDRLWSDAFRLGKAMEQILEWYDEALFRPCLDRRFRLSRAADAHTRVENDASVGKVLLIP